MSFMYKLQSLFHSETTQGKVIRNVFWATIGKVVTLMSALFVGIFVARYLGPEQYGLMNYIISIVTLFSVFSSFGTTEIIIRELSKKDISKEEILGTSFCLRIILAVITFIGIALYLFISAETTEIIIMVLIYASSLFFSCFDVIRYYFTSIIQNEYVVKSEIARTFIAALIKIILLILQAPLIAFIIALSFDFFLLASGYTLAYRKKVGNLREWKINKDFGRKLLVTSFPLMISSAAMIIYQRIDQVMIGKLLNNEQLGFFSTAASLVGVVTFIPTIMVQTVSPILIRYKNEDEQLYQKEAQRMMNVTTWLAFLISSVMSFLSYYILLFTYGIEYIAAVPALQVLAFKAVGIALTMTGGQLIIIENIHQLAFIRNILSCFVCVICNYYFIPKYGIVGSAWATIITVMFTGGLANIFIPSYRHILRKQVIALFLGWKDITTIKKIIKR